MPRKISRSDSQHPDPVIHARPWSSGRVKLLLTLQMSEIGSMPVARLRQLLGAESIPTEGKTKGQLAIELWEHVSMLQQLQRESHIAVNAEEVGDDVPVQKHLDHLLLHLQQQQQQDFSVVRTIQVMKRFLPIIIVVLFIFEGILVLRERFAC